MKSLLFIIICTLAICGCTSLNSLKGTYYTNADNSKVKLDFYPSGRIKHYEVDSNLHSPIVRGYGHIITTVGMEAVSAGIGGAPGAAIGASGGTISNYYNRPTQQLHP